VLSGSGRALAAASGHINSRRAGKRWRACEAAGGQVVWVSRLGARWPQVEFRGVKTSNPLPNAAHMTGHAVRKSTL
jgi:hypothetical protein